MPFLLNSENVSQYLFRSQLCSEVDLLDIQVEAVGHGKNFNLLVSLPNNRKLLVKQERHSRNGKSAMEFVREWQFHSLLRQFVELGQFISKVSEAVYFDASNSIIIYNYLIDYFDVNEFYQKENNFSDSIAAAITKALATLHQITFNKNDYQTFIVGREKNLFFQNYNYVKEIDRIRPEILGSTPDDCLKFFVLYQRYESLGEAVTDLTTSWNPLCVIHGDLKLSNILLHKNWWQIQQKNLFSKPLIKLIDWERCIWGDPAFDLGTIIAGYLQIWIDSLITDISLSIEESLSLARTPLKILHSSLLSAISSYLKSFPTIIQYYPNFLKRVIQFAGLSLIEKILAIIEHQKHFGNKSIYMLQVAKSLLCRPQQSMVNIFGITEAELINNIVFTAV
jgi:serine/threonine protein kinase